MKIVQSLWTAPSHNDDPRIRYNRSNGGWLESKYHYMSMMLSCLTLKKFYPQVELVTDIKGKELLIDTLDLPYTNVVVSLNQLDKYNHGLWALPKLYAYGIQQEPFLHVDNDVFVWAPINPDLTRAPLIAQSLEEGFEHYGICFKIMQDIFSYVPELFTKAFTSSEKFNASNAGILGGQDYEFFQQYSREAFRIIDANTEAIQHHVLHSPVNDLSSVNIIIEQYLFYHLAKEKEKNIEFLIHGLKNDFKDILDFSQVPGPRNYIHMLGMAKKMKMNCEQVEYQLCFAFPKQYRHLCRQLEIQPIGTTRTVSYASNADKLASKFPFQRLKQLLEDQLPANSEEDTAQTGKQIAKLIKSYAGEQRAFLEQLFSLESLTVTQQKKKNAESRRFRDLMKSYAFLANVTDEELLMQPLTTSSTFEVVKTSWPGSTYESANLSATLAALTSPGEYFTAIVHTDQGLHEFGLDSWRKLLYYFHGQAISGNDIVKAFGNDVGEDPEINSKLEKVVADFIRYELVYSGYLCLPKSASYSAKARQAAPASEPAYHLK